MQTLVMAKEQYGFSEWGEKPRDVASPKVKQPSNNMVGIAILTIKTDSDA